MCVDDAREGKKERDRYDLTCSAFSWEIDDCAGAMHDCIYAIENDDDEKNCGE